MLAYTSVSPSKCLLANKRRRFSAVYIRAKTHSTAGVHPRTGKGEMIRSDTPRGESYRKLREATLEVAHRNLAHTAVNLRASGNISR